MSINDFTLIVEPYPVDDRFTRDWKAMHHRSKIAGPFESLEWMELAAKHYGDEFKVMPVRFVDKQNETRGLGFLRETRTQGKFKSMRVLRTIENNSQRILPILAENWQDVRSSLLSLHQHCSHKYDAFDFFKLSLDEDDGDELRSFLETAGIRSELKQFNHQPRLLLPESWDAYFRSFSKQSRKKIKKFLRKTNPDIAQQSSANGGSAEYEHSFRYERLDSDQFSARDRSALLDAMHRVFKASWQYETMYEQDPHAPEQYFQYYLDVIDFAQNVGILDLNLFCADEELIAFDMNFVFRNVVYMLFGAYNQAFFEYSPGTTLLIEIIQSSITAEYDIIEFGGDHLEYKTRWTNGSMNSYHLRLWGKTLWGRLACLLKNSN